MGGAWVMQLKSKYMTKYFQTIFTQREQFFADTKHVPAWRRPQADKWSLGETLYHLLLMMKLFRRVSSWYIPLMYPFANITKHNSYATETYNIYEEYQLVKKKAMPAPSILIPPKGLENKWMLSVLNMQLETETKKLIHQVVHIDDCIAGHIRYPDPIAKYPNLIQSIHLLAIHEQHHFDLVKKYERL